MKGSILRKVRKYDFSELISWVSFCQLDENNRDKYAYIEYALGVLATQIDGNQIGDRSVDERIMNQFFNGVLWDFDECRKGLSSDLQTYFSLGPLTIRGHGFPWQYAYVADMRYSPHDEWMSNHLGFTIGNAIDFSKKIIMKISKKQIISQLRMDTPFSEEKYYDPKFVSIPDKSQVSIWKNCITFSLNELEDLIQAEQADKMYRFLDRMSVDTTSSRPLLRNPMEFNILNERPIIKMKNEFLLPIPKLLWHSISSTFHYDLLRDRNYKGRYLDSKGRRSESIIYNILNKIYEDDNIFPRVKYYRDHGEPDIDIIVCDDDNALFIECSSKQITIEAKKGNLNYITKDIGESIIKCYTQLKRAYEAYQKNKLIEKKFYKIIPVIVLDDYISHINLILKYIDIKMNDFIPYIINIYDLDIITDLITKKELWDFIIKRIELFKKGVIYSADELDYFVMYKKYGLEKYADELVKKNSMLLYIGHLEELYPSYYFEKFSPFCEDMELLNLMRRKGVSFMRGWS